MYAWKGESVTTYDDSHLERLPHVLYKMYDDERRLLYVGISANLGKRLDRHMRDKLWFQQIAYIAVTHYATRTECLLAERHAIVSERPIHNLAHSGAAGDPFAGAPASAVRIEDLPPKAPEPCMARSIMFDHGMGFMQWDLFGRVRHEAFGSGTIVGLLDDGQNSQVSVCFDDETVGRKILLLRSAPLEFV
jgi:predicted GIY-YIG superfamily endonuclease